LKTLTLTLTAVVMGALVAVSPVRAAEPAKDPQVIGLLFYADWCGSCKVLEPKLETVKEGLTGEPITFTRVDMTDDATKAYSERYARWIGLGSIYEEHAPGTGFMLLVDAESKEVLGRLTRVQSEDELRASILAAVNR
jgi:thiol-disulfide isomerase/thioredoxin